jgi:CubicO group peptidase (beta-lactamase class C family)
MSFDAFLQEHIFIPLKMFDTHCVLPANKTGRLARMYQLDANGKISEMAQDYSHLLSRTYISGGTGLMSTARDYMRFAQMILNGGVLEDVRLLSPKSVELMTSNSIGALYAAFRQKSGDKFGLGFGIRTERGTYDELESIGIFGWDGTYYTRFFIDPSEEIIGIFLSQCAGCWGQDHDLIAKFRVLMYQSLLE